MKRIRLSRVALASAAMAMPMTMGMAGVASAADFYKGNRTEAKSIHCD